MRQGGSSEELSERSPEEMPICQAILDVLQSMGQDTNLSRLRKELHKKYPDYEFYDEERRTNGAAADVFEHLLQEFLNELGDKREEHNHFQSVNYVSADPNKEGVMCCGAPMNCSKTEVVMFTKVSAPTSGGIIVLPEVEATGVCVEVNLLKWAEGLVHGTEDEGECQWSQCEERDERRFIPSTRTVTHLPQQFAYCQQNQALTAEANELLFLLME